MCRVLSLLLHYALDQILRAGSLAEAALQIPMGVIVDSCCGFCLAMILECNFAIASQVSQGLLILSEHHDITDKYFGRAGTLCPHLHVAQAKDEHSGVEKICGEFLLAQSQRTQRDSRGPQWLHPKQLH